MLKNIVEEIQDKGSLTAWMNEYITAHNEKVQAAEKYYNETLDGVREKRKKILDRREKAFETGDVAALVNCEMEENRAEELPAYALSVLEAIKAEPVFPDGAVMRGWTTICNECRAAYIEALEAVTATALAYKAANAKFMKMHEALIHARKEIQAIANQYGSTEDISKQPLLTTDMKAESFNIISKQETIRIGNSVDPALSRKL